MKAGIDGRTSPAIDAVNCSDVDPAIHVINGPYDKDPGWPSGAFENGNNKSIVIRVDFGKSSFLFPGDLEDDAIASMVEHYQNARTLDVDILEVGHHGSYNGTSADELTAISPLIAVISMGDLTSQKPFTAWSYGHPRKQTVDLLEGAVHDSRNKSGVFNVATAAKEFSDYDVRHAIYATGWDGNIIITADSNKHYQVLTNQ